ncbi:MAG: aspartyl protease family protein [Candidatus Caldarchaeum sp.]|nr:aspartyl protease family protein [Candidatus Caldarchaeum sp.]
MGYVFVDAEVGDVKRQFVKKVRLLVDTGAGFMVLPPKMAEELGIEPVSKIDVTLADGSKKSVDLGFAYVRVMDREVVAHVLIMECPEPLLGTFTMQLLGLAVDPNTEQIKPSRSFAVGLLAQL